MAEARALRNTPKGLGVKIHQAMEEWALTSDNRKPLSSADLAKLLKTTPATVSKWISGKSDPSPEFVEGLCDVFKKPKWWFYDEQGHGERINEYVVDAILQILRNVRNGMSFDAAVDRETGDPLSLSRRDRKAMQETQPELLQQLRAATPGWERATPEEQVDLMWEAAQPVVLELARQYPELIRPQRNHRGGPRRP